MTDVRKITTINEMQNRNVASYLATIAKSIILGGYSWKYFIEFVRLME